MGGGTRDSAVSNAPCSDPVVLYDDGLTKGIPHTLCNNTSYSVRRPARRGPNDNCDRPCRICLALCNARHGWDRGSARGQMQKLSAKKFHFESPRRRGRAALVALPVRNCST